VSEETINLAEYETPKRLATRIPPTRGRATSHTTISRWQNAGKLPYLKLGTAKLSRFADIIAMIRHETEEDQKRRGLTPKKKKTGTDRAAWEANARRCQSAVSGTNQGHGR
jgi:hypothetical protein